MKRTYDVLGKIELNLTPFEFDFIIKSVDKFIDENKITDKYIIDLKNDIYEIYKNGYFKGDEDDEEYN